MLNVFYGILNRGYRFIFGSRYMLHAPLFLKDDDKFFDAQCHFGDYCMSFLPSITGKKVLDIGCGNGMLTLHLLREFQPSYIYGIDNVPSQINIANRNIKASEDRHIGFAVDNAQQLNTVADNSFDVVICFESALHYPDKRIFISQIKRVLAPDGVFLIADLLRKDIGSPTFVQRIFHLFNWSLDQYVETFNLLQFKLTVNRNLNDFLLPQLKMLDETVSKETLGKNRVATALVFFLAKPAIRLYVYHLMKVFRYQLFVGKNHDMK